MPNTGDQSGWLRLLATLSDDELRRYGEIAAEQRRLEWRYGWAQVLCVIGSLAACFWFLNDLRLNGLSWRGGAILGLAAAIGYWPYRKAFVRHLWGKHCKAVANEAAQRRAAARTR